MSDFLLSRVALEEKSSSDTQALEKGQQEEMVQLRDKVMHKYLNMACITWPNGLST